MISIETTIDRLPIEACLLLQEIAPLLILPVEVSVLPDLMPPVEQFLNPEC
jgi:hypothetical protein